MGLRRRSRELYKNGAVWNLKLLTKRSETGRKFANQEGLPCGAPSALFLDCNSELLLELVGDMQDHKQFGS